MGWDGARWPGSAIEPVARELVGVDLDADPRPGTDRELPAADHQRFGEQVVGHVEVVGELAGAAGGVPVSGAERDRACGADLSVDLVPHDDLDAEALALVEDPLRGGETGAGG